MFQATNSRMAASAASGTWCASGAASNMTSNNATACTMPATGLVAPLFTLVTVRAMVPVAGMPPKKGVTKLAMPCAISSWFGLWRAPIMPSATRAHSSDSMAPRKASVRVGTRRNRAVSHEKAGHCSDGSVDGMPPKRLPMVSTGRPQTATSTVVSSSTTTEPGTSTRRRATADLCAMRGNQACHAMMVARLADAIATAVQFTVPTAANSTTVIPKKLAGMAGVTSPRKSRTCDSAINTAMPLVKPITTATGTNRIKVPSLNSPIRNSSTPDMAVAMTRLARP